MKMQIIRIEPRIVTCEIDNTGSLLNIARRWFTDDIQVGDVIDIDISEENDKY